MNEHSSQPVRILVVDDDPAMQHMVVDYFEQHNMSAVSASGREAMASAFALGEPSLVILDLRLGQEDGLDLLREMRSRSDVPVIITTGHRRDGIDRVVGLGLAGNDYGTHPQNVRQRRGR